MAISEAQKRASNKYNLEHMTTLGCKVKKKEATAFKEYSLRHGKTTNTLLKEYVIECINEDNDGKLSVNRAIDETNKHVDDIITTPKQPIVDGELTMNKRKEKYKEMRD